MERLRRRLVLQLLLLLGLAGAAAAAGAEAQPCEPTILATQAARFCASGSGLPTALCCTVLASVDRGGGVPCLCRVAAQPEAVLAGLSTNHLMSLHIACGGRFYTERARLAAAFSNSSCLGSPPLAVSVMASPPAVPVLSTVASPPAVVLLEKQAGSSCNSTLLGIELTRYCREGVRVPIPPCCRSVLMTIDDKDKDCLCRVMETGDIVVSGYLDVQLMWDLYRECGGRSQAVPKDRDRCAHALAPSPRRSPPPPSSPPPPAVPEPEHLSPVATAVISVLVVVTIVVMVVAVVKIGWRIWKKLQEAGQEAEHARERALQEEEHARERALQEAEHARQEALQEERDLHELRMLPRAPLQSLEMQPVRDHHQEAQLS